jgi:N-acetyltransferase 10
MKLDCHTQPEADQDWHQEKKRSFIVVVGDRAKDVIVNLHYIMSSVDIKQNKSVLWAYKKDLLGFTRHGLRVS